MGLDWNVHMMPVPVSETAGSPMPPETSATLCAMSGHLVMSGEEVRRSIPT
ncbi:hypothetical protein D3C83_321910 [compost metagenome]